jgi:hypothetical protein
MEPNQQHNIYQPALSADREESIDIKKYLFKFLANYLARKTDNVYLMSGANKTAGHGASVNEISFRIPAKEFTYFDWNY